MDERRHRGLGRRATVLDKYRLNPVQAGTEVQMNEERRQTTIRSAPAPLVVEAHACGMCTRIFRTEGEARVCCTCPTCGIKREQKASDAARDCDACFYPTQIRWACDEVERATARLHSAQQAVQQAEERLRKLRAREALKKVNDGE